jgi:hypothetical protein
MVASGQWERPAQPQPTISADSQKGREMATHIRKCLMMGVCAGLTALGVSASAQVREVQEPLLDGKSAAPRSVLPPAKPTPKTVEGRPDLSGIWAPSASGVIELRAPGLGAPPTARVEPPAFQRWALEKQKRMGPLANAEPSLRCEPLGVVRFLTNPYPAQIVQTPELVVILSELTTTYRRIWIDGRPHRSDADPLFNGDVIGRWEGDTLVTSVKALDVHEWVGQPGFFISDAAQITERFRRPDSNTLLYQYTVEDPKVLTKPWTSAERRLTVSLSPMVEYYCTNERDSEVFLKQGRTYISPTGLDERYFDEDEYQELKKQFSGR